MPSRTPQWTRRIVATATASLALAGAAGCEISYADRSTAKPATTGSTVDPQDARGRLAKLTVTKPGSMRGYSREHFAHWRRTGDNCDVRDSVLKRDGEDVKFRGCNVVGGTWLSRYDGKRITTPTQVDIDHMVPLANAWRSGAADWTDDERSDFANDLDSPQLVAVSISSNRAKGDQDPSTWKPKVHDAWCSYAEDWIAVKARWKLTVTAAEKVALIDMLETC